MTNVLSLTAATSAGFTNISSMLMATEAQSFQAISIDELTNLAGMDIGALWRRDHSTVNSLPAATWSGLTWGSLGWDTGSWTDSNSVGLLRVPNDKWAYVEIGATAYIDCFNDGAFRIVTIAGTSNGSINYPYMTFNYDGNTAFAGTIYTIIPVSSGDVFQAQAFITGGANADDNSATEFDGFWIRGYSARG